MTDKKSRAREGGPSIIGTGLPRTGTTSLCEALETLGFDPCHHFRGMTFKDSFPYPDMKLWSKAAKTEDKDARQDMLHHLLTNFGGKSCKAAVDYPASCFIDDMVEMYPNAKFIHAERSSPEAWRKSFNATVGRVHQDYLMKYGTYLIPFLTLAIAPVTKALDERNERIFGASIYSFDTQIELYHAHNAFVRRIVPKDSLLEFDPKQGYGPLCEFLNVPVPTDDQGNRVEFPHVNDSASMQRGFKFATILGFGIWGVVLGGGYWALSRTVARFL